MASPSKNPPQSPLEKIQGPKNSKFDIGTRRRAGDAIGPTIQKPAISKDRQDSVPGGKTSSTNGRGEDAKTVDREYIPSEINYGVR